jgi:hypothetical protein
MNYLIILISLVVFFSILVIYLKKKNSTFDETTLIKNNQNIEQQQVYKLDTRYDYPLNAPVNPIAYKSVVLNSVPVSKNLYSNQEIDSTGYILNENMNENQDTNQLNYSGGSTQLIKIPLQFNEPYNEQLRTQDVLITPYNKIKYGMNC